MQNRFSFLFTLGMAWLLLPSTGWGQMPAAQRIPPALEVRVSLDADADRVWAYVCDPENYAEFSGTAAFTFAGKTPESKISLTTAQGARRRQTIGMIAPPVKRISYAVSESDYEADKPWFYGFEVLPGEKENTCTVVLAVYFGFDELPSGMKTALTEEFNDIAGGLSKKFN